MQNSLLGAAFVVGFIGGLVFFYEQLTNWVMALFQ
jgi:hypothetical protein